MWRAFRYRNYRLFFGGQVVSLVGSWITMTATSWLVYRLTNSAFLLGVVGFASQVPAFLLTPFAGIYVDRWNRHRLLVGTQVASMLIAFVLAALTLSSTISIRWLIVVSVCAGIVNAFDLPVRQAFVVLLIEDKRDLGNAIALNSSMFNAARLVGPSIAGAIIALTSEGWCYAIDGVSYLAVIAARSDEGHRGGWQSLSAQSIGFALIGRVAVRGEAFATQFIDEHLKHWLLIAEVAPELTSIDLVLASAMTASLTAHEHPTFADQAASDREDS